MRKLFTLLIVLFLWAGSSWGQSETMIASQEVEAVKVRQSDRQSMKPEKVSGIKIPNIQITSVSPKATTAVYLTQDFETAFSGSPAAPSGWTQSRFVLLGDGLPEAGGVNGEKDWQQNTWDGTAWTVPGYAGIKPTGAVSGTGVLFMEDGYFGSTTTSTGGYGSRRVETPEVNLSAATSPYVRFFYFYNSASSNMHVRVMASKDGGDTWSPIMIVSPNAGVTAMTSSTPWQRINVKIPADFITENAKFGIEMTNTWGTNDIFIDDFSIEDFTPSTITSVATGLWSATATWDGGIVPTSDNHVIIDAGHVVSVDVNIARCQNMTIDGTLQYNSTSTTQLIDIYGNLTVNSGGFFNSFNSTTGKRTYVGGSVINNGTLNFSIGAGNLVWKGGAPATYSGSGVLTNGFISNIWHANAGGVTYNAPVEVRNVVGLYMGDVNPNGNLIVGNIAVTTQTVERTSLGSFTQAPTWTPGITRSVSYITANIHVPTKTLYYTGYEIPVVDGVGVIGGTFAMSTYDNVQLSLPVELGTTTTGTLTLTRGILITSDANLLTLKTFSTGHAGTAASTLTPPITHGSYIVGPIRINFPSTGTTTRNFPLGVGTGFNGSTPNSNILKLVALSSSTAWTGSTVKMSIAGAPSGTVNSPLNYLMGSYAYRADLLGGADLPANTTITIRGINYTFGNSDNLFGDQGQLRIAQSPSLTGPWTERSNSSGSGSFVNNTLYSRTTSVASPGPIAPFETNGEYFALASTATVVDPSGVTATAVSSSQINVTFTPNVFNNNVVVVFNTTGTFTDPSGPPPAIDSEFAGGTLIYNGLVSPVQHIGRNAATTYYYKLFSYDGSNYSPGAIANATTLCDIEPAPTAVQDFSTYNGAAPPPVCWLEATGALTANSTLTYGSSEWVSSTGFANTGTNKGVKVNLYSSGNDWIISQSIDLGDTPGLFRVKFNMAVTSYNGTVAQSTLGTHVVNVVVSTDNGVTWSNANIIKTYTGAGTYSNTGQIEVINLTGYSGVVKIGFYETTSSTSPDIDFHIDDFVVESASTPSLVADPSFINFGSVVSGGTSDEFLYNLTGTYLSPETGDISITPPANFEVSSVPGGPYSAAPITIGYNSGALSATVYAVFKPTSASTNYSGSIVNSGGGANPTDVAVIGASPCEAEAAPTAVQDFSTFTGIAPPPICWSEATGVLAASSTLTYGSSEWTSSTGFANSGTNKAVRVNLYSSGNDWLISQQIDLGATPGLYRVKFNMAVTSYLGTAAQSTLGTHRVDIVVSTDGGSTWSNTDIIKTYTGPGTYSNTGQIETIDLAGYSGVVKIAFVETTSSTSPDIDFHIDDFVVEAIPTATLSWYNLQWPGSATIFANQNETIYAQCWESGVTEDAGPGTGIECWIGYSSDNTNPNTWTYWVPATYNYGVDPNNNDEYMASLGAAQGLAPGTYYYASRFRYLSGPFTYGGFSGGPWNGTSNVSGVLTVNTVPPATMPLTEGFESGQGNWISVNTGQTNQWYVGTAVAKTGTQSAYISNDGGVSNSYNVGTTSVSHIYRDITFPAGTNPFDLKFSWKGQGEGTTTLYDYLRVFVVPTSTTPVAGTQLTSGQVGVTYNLQPDWQDVTLELDNATYAGQTWRVVFSWRNDNSLGTQPPAAIDDIVVEEQAPTTKTLNLTSVLPEGLYAGGGLLNQASNDFGPQFDPGIADQIIVELHNALSYGTIEYTIPDVDLSTSGAVSITDIPAIYSGDYYITVKHRNSIETTSASPVSFAGSVINQSFATPADVYGGNLLLMADNGYAIYGGDVNQDGFVDTGDITDFDNDQFNYITGYVSTDVNGDATVDSFDGTIIDNNQFNYISAVLP